MIKADKNRVNYFYGFRGKIRFYPTLIRIDPWQMPFLRYAISPLSTK